MKIATFNVNNVNRRLPNLLNWLDAAKPDAVCLQELKAEDRQFPHKALCDVGYSAVWQGERQWNGVAILRRGTEPVVTRRRLPGDPADKQSRYIEAAVKGVLIACIYLPNGNPQPGPKFEYKLAWFERLIVHAATLHATDAPVILAGDFNVVPTDFDIYRTRSWLKNALPRRGPATGDCLNRVGQMRCARSIRPIRCIPSGSTSETRGPATRACGWIICSSTALRRHACKRLGWIDMCAGRRGLAIMRLRGCG